MDLNETLPTRALDLQLDLLRYYTRTEMGRRYAESVISEALAIGSKEPVPDIGIRLHELVLIGETYAVSAEILGEKTKEELRSTVEAAVTELSALLEGTECGSTLTFVKHDDRDRHYYYAAVKSGGRWYTTAERQRVIDDDYALIEWLIGLEIYAAPQLSLTATAFPEQHAIEASATEA